MVTPSNKTASNLSYLASFLLLLLTFHLLSPLSLPLSTPPTPFHLTIPFKHHVKMLPLKLTTTRSHAPGSVVLDLFLPHVTILEGEVRIEDEECTVRMSGDLNFPSAQTSKITTSLSRTSCGFSTLSISPVLTHVTISLLFLNLLNLKVDLDCESMLNVKLRRNWIGIDSTRCYIKSIT
ncbi:hypothetical protein TL16_g08354 [Triparma laevis f. inornata]|uniref:Uncharacterized protein n=1 Tax=Triparma laevis f. inornata TaxID=1714386 RepID=A0A9W7AXT3_9STRA|nr:hypothetical protein TL16_g08354 [Triparma laevis f. inornata]